MKTYKYAVLIYSNEKAGIINGTMKFIQETVQKLPNVMGVSIYSSYEAAKKSCIQLNK